MPASRLVQRTFDEIDRSVVVALFGRAHVLVPGKPMIAARVRVRSIWTQKNWSSARPTRERS
jgi:hypothetical protein